MNTPFKSIRLIKWVFINSIVFLTLLLASCLNNDQEQPITDVSWVSIYNGIADSPALDIRAGAGIINENSPLRYSEFFPYQQFFPGNRTLTFHPHNGINVLLESQVTLNKDSVYSIFLVNSAAAMEAMLVKDIWEEPNDQEGQLRFIHLSPDAGDVEILVNNEKNTFQNTIPFKGYSTFSKLNKGNFNFAVRSVNSGEILVAVNNVEIKGNRVYTLILRGLNTTANPDSKLSIQLSTNYIKF